MRPYICSLILCLLAAAAWTQDDDGGGLDGPPGPAVETNGPAPVAVDPLGADQPTGATDEDLDMPDLNGDWVTGKVRIAIDQTGEEITATYKVIGKNPLGIEPGDAAFTGTFEDREFTGTIFLYDKKADGEVVKRPATLSLTLADDGRTLRGEHELLRYDADTKEWTTLERKQAVVLTLDGGGEFVVRIVKKQDHGLQPGRVDGSFEEANKAVYGEPFYVEVEYAKKQTRKTLTVELKSPAGTQSVLCVVAVRPPGITLYRSDPIYATAPAVPAADTDDAKPPATTEGETR